MNILKSFSLSLFLLVFASNLFGQKKKIDIDSRKVLMEYMSVPQSRDLSDFDTYSIHFVAKQETLNKLEIRPSDIQNFFQLEGFTYIKEGQGEADLIFSIQIGDVNVMTEKVVESSREVKNSDGTVQTITEYAPLVEMSAPTVIQIINNENGEKLFLSVFSTRNNPTIFETKPGDKASADRLIKIKTSGLNTNIQKNYKNKLNSEIQKLKNLYTYQKGQYTQEFMDIDIKDSPELKELHEEIVKVSSSIAKASYKEPLYTTQQALAPILNSWSENADKLSNVDKYEKKLKFVYLYNLAVSQFWLEQFEDALNSCDRIVAHDYKTYEATEIKKNVNAVRDYLAKYGYPSRHFYRPGFYSHYDYVYTKQTIERKSWKLMVEDYTDISDLEKAAKDLKNIAKGIVEELTLGDTILSSNAYYSSLKFTLDGKVHEYKNGLLYIGNGDKSYSKKYYSLSCFKRTAIDAANGKFSGMMVDIFPNDTSKNALTPENILALIKAEKGQVINDIYIPWLYLDSVGFKKNGVVTPPNLDSWESYSKSFAAEVDFRFGGNSRDGDVSYTTMNGDQIQIELMETRPIIVKGNGQTCTQGYMAKFRIPSVKVTRKWFGHYSPMFTADQKVITDIEFYILIK